MRLSQIKEFLSNNISSAVLKESMQNEVNDYIALSSKKGGSAPVILTEDTSMIVKNSDIENLCKAYIRSELSESDVYYIMDALLLSSNVNFESEALMEVSETLTDPSVNGNLTKDTVMEVLRYCKS